MATINYMLYSKDVSNDKLKSVFLRFSHGRKKDFIIKLPFLITPYDWHHKVGRYDLINTIITELKNHIFNNMLVYCRSDKTWLNKEIKYFKNNLLKEKGELKETKKTYLLYDGELYKIGKSVDPKERTRTISHQNPRAQLLCIIPFDVEIELHQKYKSKKVHHEWFNLDESDVKYIINYKLA